jgi:putative Mg2+ transporter-C (MgtC) family protein
MEFMVEDLEFLLRVLLAGALAGVLGWERESLGKPAGFRTHVLVGMGATLVIGVGEGLADLFSRYGELLRFDPMRLTEAVLVGIGFLGAGSIITRRHREDVSGLTTAAGLWATGAVGLTVGVGREVLALGVTAIIFVVLRVLGYVEKRHRRNVRPDAPTS